MFRFVYAMHANEAWTPAHADAAYAGVECDADPPAGVARVGVRAVGGKAIIASTHGLYHVIDAPTTSPSEAGRSLRQSADRLGDPVWIENGGAYATAHAIWTLLDAAGHPRVKAAIDADAARAAGQTPGVLVPTLNLKIGLLRVRTPHADVVDYARRLAGIGFDGFVVTDPPTGPARLAAAVEIVAVFRGIFPAKSTKKPSLAKATA